MTVTVRPRTHLIKLIERREVADRTLAIWLQKPADFDFTAGQFAELSVPNPEVDAASEPEHLAFSMASSPEETELMFATRIRGGTFKQALRNMALGSEIQLEGPYGNFILHDDATRPAVFLAGGIGITPVRSILVHAAKAKLPNQLVLFYSNREPEEAAFLDELRDLQSLNPNYRFIPVMTQSEKSKSGWVGETGHIDKEMISKYLDAVVAPIYYVVGSPAFVQALREMLRSAGVKNDDIRSEDFVGY